MKLKNQYLYFAIIFIAGLFIGAILNISIEKSTDFQSPESSASPQAKEVDSRRSFHIATLILEKDAFTIAYDARCKNPYYVVEVLTKESLQGSSDRANHKFKEDKAIPVHLRVTLADYKGSGFDRGHLSPAADNKKSSNAMQESFLLSNICPQQPQFNRGYWAKFEGKIRDLTKQYKSVQVVTGPLYLPKQGEDGKRYVMYQVIGSNDVAVPTHFFKVLMLERKSGSIKEMAYILPNEYIAPETPLEAFQSTVEKVECVSGIIFKKNS